MEKFQYECQFKTRKYQKLSVIETSGLHLIPLFICRGQLIGYF